MASVPAPVPSASLYVGDLSHEVTEAQLYELFSQIGPVASIRVCRDAVTRRSLGYAYVNYNTALDAERALDALNYQPVNGRAMRIMWSLRDPSARRSGLGNIFIKNLEESIDNRALHDTFVAFGKIQSVRVAMDKEGQSRGYGFVQFETEESANLAIEKVNGMEMAGKRVFVGRFLKKSERDTDATTSKFTNVFVKNLDLEITDAELSDRFAQFGKISNLVVMKDEGGMSKGFGFVNFEEPEEAKAAVEGMNNVLLGSKNLYVGRAQKKSERMQFLAQQYEEKRQERIHKYMGVNLFVKNLADEVDDDKLREEFLLFGSITSAKVMRDERGGSRGFGFVCFTATEEATKAVTKGNGKMIFGKPIFVALAQRREARRQQLEQQFAHGSMAGIMPGGMPAQQMAPAGVVAAGVRPGQMMPAAMSQMYAPNGAPLYYAAPAGMIPAPGGVGQRPAMVYQQMMPRGGGGQGWRAQGGGMRPNYQQPPGYPGPTQAGPNPGRQRQNRQRPSMQQQQQQQPGVGPTPLQAGPGPMGPKDFARNGPRSSAPRPTQPNFKYIPNGRILPNGTGPTPAGATPAAQTMAQIVSNGQPATGAPVAGAAAPPPMSGGAGGHINSSRLAAATPPVQKQILGESLFPLVHQKQPELAGKITGMLLEMDNSELLLLLESPDALVDKIDEALAVLSQHVVGEEQGGMESQPMANGSTPVAVA